MLALFPFSLILGDPTCHNRENLSLNVWIPEMPLFYPSFSRWGIKLACVSPNLVRNPDGSQDQPTAETWEWCGDNMELGVHHKSIFGKTLFFSFLSLVIFIWCLGLHGKVTSSFQTFLCSHHDSCSVQNSNKLPECYISFVEAFKRVKKTPKNIKNHRIFNKVG